MERLGVIFDMDGVLVDSYDAHLRSWQLLAGEHGVEMTEEQFAATFGQTSREIIRRFWPQQAGGEAGIARWDARKEELYREILREDFPAMAGANALLRALHEAGFALAIGSSGPPENVRVVCEQMETGGLFAAAVDGMQVEHGKPAPDVFLRAAEKLSLPPACCAVVEDAPAGVEAARRAGMACAALTGTVPAEALSAADVVVDALEELSPGRFREMLRGRDGA
jgi:beta-phosphoglucomutase